MRWNRNRGPRRTCALGWNGLIAAMATQADGYGEREAALLLLDTLPTRLAQPKCSVKQHQKAYFNKLLSCFVITSSA